MQRSFPGARPRREAARLVRSALIGGVLLAVAGAPALATKYAAEFLRLGVGARALGMGGGFTALADDGSAAYWNPAGLATLERAEMLFMHAEQFGSLSNHDFIGFVQPLSRADRRSAVGLGLIRYSVDDILVTRDAFDDLDHNGQRDPGEPILRERFRTDSDAEYALLLSYSREVGDGLFLGGNAKLIRQALLSNTSFGMGLDLGAIYRPTPAWSFGARLADATNTVLSWDTGTREMVRPSLDVGFSWTRPIEAVHGRLVASATLASSFDNEKEASQVSGGFWGGELQGGLEYWYGKSIAARLGSDAGNLTAGAGLRFRGLGADYAYLSHPDLEATHRVSASVRF